MMKIIPEIPYTNRNKLNVNSFLKVVKQFFKNHWNFSQLLFLFFCLCFS